MENTIHLIFQSIEDAVECKQHFGNDYSMYCSYCDQFRRTTDNTRTRVIPVSEAKYNQI